MHSNTVVVEVVPRQRGVAETVALAVLPPLALAMLLALLHTLKGGRG